MICEDVIWYRMNCEGPEWARVWGYSTTLDEIFLSYVAINAKITEAETMVRSVYDSAPVILCEGHRYFAASWIKRDFPEERERIARCEAWMRQAYLDDEQARHPTN